MTKKKELPKCARTVCNESVGKARNRYCSPTCAQLDSRKSYGGNSVGSSVPIEVIVTDGNTRDISTRTAVRIETLEDLIAHCKIDTAEWEIKRWTCNKWEWPGESGPEPLFQVKAQLERRTTLIAVKQEIEALKDEAKLLMPKRPAIIRTQPLRGPSGNMLELSIPDLHVGKLAWAKETGWENYDTKIAERIFRDAVEALLARTSCHRFDEIVFVVGNDLMNSDNSQNTTTAGTPQSTDGRYHKTFSIVRRMITSTVDALRGVAPVVRVLFVPGNHDTLAVWHLGDSVECFFNNTPGVIIDNSPNGRKYHQFGKVMLMWTHGDKGKLPDYPLVMATEQPVMWGQTSFREAHTGHRHHLKVDEYHGVKVRVSPALCPPDAWHAENHYVGAGRSAEAFVWNETEGLIATANFNVPSPAAISQAA